MSEKEVEIKIKLDSQSINTVQEALQRRADKIESRTDRDTYYTAPIRDFLETNECLRIRETDEYTELTYKGRTTQEMIENKQFWKEEIDIPIERAEAQTLLKALGCKKIVTVEKDRTIYHIGDLEATLDNIQHAGWFLEVETAATTEAEVDAALEQNRTLLEQIGADGGSVVERPYRDIVLDNKDA